MTFFLCLFLMSPATAQEDDFPQRLELAQKILEIRPAKEQLESAVDTYITQYMFAYPENEQEIFRMAMLSALNDKALEKTAVDAYAEIFTREELDVLVAYYSAPEAASIREKQGLVNARITPEIVKMLDQALMRVRTQMKKTP